MGADVPDIVVDTQLEVHAGGKHTIYFHHVGDEASNKRPEKLPEKWALDRKIGSGGFSDVWLERCVSTSATDECRVRAIKKIYRRGTDALSTHLCRELEAVGKFSQKPVCLLRRSRVKHKC
jgi:hypothetical protein